MTFDPTLPLTHARTLPAAWYRDPGIYARELRTAFADSWQCVGRAEQVAKPGEYLAASVGGEPVLVVRGEDGVLRGFHNVCRHRAYVLFPAGESGCVGKLRCKYHGWTYDLTGKLRGTPEFDGVCEFEKADNGLVPVAAAEWGPFVWVCVAGPREPLEAFLAPLPAWAAGADPFAGLQWRGRRTYPVPCNWKVYVDNYLDGGYHVNTVHPALAGVLDYREYRTTTHGNTALQTSPLVPGDGAAGATRTGTAAFYWWVWPNFMLNAYGGVVDTNLVEPLGPDRCAVHFDFFFPPETPQEFVDSSIAVAETVQDEDRDVCAGVQAGLNSRSYDTGRFSAKRENAGYYFHQKVFAAVGE